MSKAFTASGQAGTTLRTESQCASRPRMRHWAVAAACLALVGVAHAGGNDQFEEAPTQMAMLSTGNITNDSFNNTPTTTNINTTATATTNTSASNAPNAKLQQQAVMGQSADVGTTAAGLLMGASEANPLGIVTLGVKLVAYQQIKEAPPVEQPRLWSMYGAFGWGAAANNLCVIAVIATGGAGAVLCPLVGLGAGMGNWSSSRAERDRATFAAICEDAQARNPQMVCTYTEPKT